MFNGVELKNISNEIQELFNRPFRFYKDIVILCEEKEVDRFDGLKVYVYPKDHPPYHLHLITKDKETIYRIVLDANFDVKTFKCEKGKLSQSHIKNFNYWMKKLDGRAKIIENLKAMEIIG